MATEHDRRSSPPDDHVTGGPSDDAGDAFDEADDVVDDPFADGGDDDPDPYGDEDVVSEVDDGAGEPGEAVEPPDEPVGGDTREDAPANDLGEPADAATDSDTGARDQETDDADGGGAESGGAEPTDAVVGGNAGDS